MRNLFLILNTNQNKGVIDQFLKSNDFIVVRPTEGLCNKIRVIAWAYDCAKQLNKDLFVEWGRIKGKNNRCPGHFYALFKKIKGIHFFPNDRFKEQPKADWSGNDAPNESINKSAQTQINFAKLLKPVDEIKEKINSNLSKLGPRFISIHIRRVDGDKQVMQKNRREYEEYINFIDSYPNHNIYIAADNRDSQLFFQKKYKERIKSIKIIEENNNLRKTSLEDAVIDMWTCSHADHFMGQPSSSFSAWIKILIKANETKNKS